MYLGPIVGFRMVPGISRHREGEPGSGIQCEIDEGTEMEALW